MQYKLMITKRNCGAKCLLVSGNIVRKLNHCSQEISEYYRNILKYIFMLVAWLKCICIDNTLFVCVCVRAHVCVHSCVCMCERERESQVEGHLACVWVHMGLSVFLLCVHICMNLSVGGYYTVCVSSHSSVSECVCLCVHVPKCHPTMCMCVWVRVCVCVCVCVCLCWLWPAEIDGL